MEQAKLDKILDEHKEWVRTNGKKVKVRIYAVQIYAVQIYAVRIYAMRIYAVRIQIIRLFLFVVVV